MPLWVSQTKHKMAAAEFLFFVIIVLLQCQLQLDRLDQKSKVLSVRDRDKKEILEKANFQYLNTIHGNANRHYGLGSRVGERK